MNNQFSSTEYTLFYSSWRVLAVDPQVKQKVWPWLTLRSKCQLGMVVCTRHGSYSGDWARQEVCLSSGVTGQPGRLGRKGQSVSLESASPARSRRNSAIAELQSKGQRAMTQADITVTSHEQQQGLWARRFFLSSFHSCERASPLCGNILAIGGRVFKAGETLWLLG